MYNHILVPIDLDSAYDWAKTVPTAVGLAKAHDARLHVMTVIPDFGMNLVGQFFPKNFEKEVSGKVLSALKEKTASAVPADIPLQHIVGEGRVYETVLRMADKVGADLIVIGAHHPELKDYLLGPNAARVVRHANCSVLVVRE